MNCEDGKMTAAESVLAWLLIEKIRQPDDVAYTPLHAQKAIEAVIDSGRSAEADRDRLSARVAELEKRLAKAEERHRRATAKLDKRFRDSDNEVAKLDAVAANLKRELVARDREIAELRSMGHAR